MKTWNEIKEVVHTVSTLEEFKLLFVNPEGGYTIPTELINENHGEHIIRLWNFESHSKDQFEKVKWLYQVAPENLQKNMIGKICRKYVSFEDNEILDNMSLFKLIWLYEQDKAVAKIITQEKKKSDFFQGGYASNLMTLIENYQMKYNLDLTDLVFEIHLKKNNADPNKKKDKGSGDYFNIQSAMNNAAIATYIEDNFKLIKALYQKGFEINLDLLDKVKNAIKSPIFMSQELPVEIAAKIVCMRYNFPESLEPYIANQADAYINAGRKFDFKNDEKIKKSSKQKKSHRDDHDERKHKSKSKKGCVIS
ncbi:MAG: hypothetical protein J0G32_06755 [Alphaproteobacteria bacterium]|nr:hypothetical protein [Alphaproteobacteria bacterium]OJV14166.1 MAG: hypothetical protein BGO27_01550 [Alphaproteobacteria bacterium 33-17]